VVGKPKLIIADEPTGNLDPGLSLEVMDIFRRFSTVGVTVVVATHDLDIVRSSNLREIMVADGRVLDVGGEPDDLPHMEALR
jgi:cell division transport system ATP-binding protein